MTYEEYRRELNEALEKADWMNPRDKNGPAYRVLARAARDKALPLAQWQKLHDEYYERTKRCRVSRKCSGRSLPADWPPTSAPRPGAL